MRRLPICILITLAILSVLSCDRKDKGVLSKRKMEDVLFDYHIAQAMTFNLRAENRDQADSYIASVFQKHGISYEQFDSSLIYYNRHQSDLSDIYNNLNKRYEKLDASLQLTTGNHEMRMAYTPGGDTAEIWSGPKLYVLRNSPYGNLQTFTLTADTSFRRQDRMHLTAEIGFIHEDATDDNAHVVTALTMHFTDGTSVSSVREQSYPAKADLQIGTFEPKDITKITGFFYYTSQSSTRNLAVIRNISLLRYHTISRSAAQSATQSAQDLASDSDTIITNSATKLPSHIRIPALAPDEKRRLNADPAHDAQIKEMPAVRTPNSIGPTRRRIRKQN